MILKKYFFPDCGNPVIHLASFVLTEWMFCFCLRQDGKAAERVAEERGYADIVMLLSTVKQVRKYNMLPRNHITY